MDIKKFAAAARLKAIRHKRLEKEHRDSFSSLAQRDITIALALWEICWVQEAEYPHPSDREQVLFEGPLRSPVGKSLNQITLPVAELAERVLRAALLLRRHRTETLQTWKPTERGEMRKAACHIIREAATNQDLQETEETLRCVLEVDGHLRRGSYESFVEGDGDNYRGFFEEIRSLAKRLTSLAQSHIYNRGLINITESDLQGPDSSALLDQLEFFNDTAVRAIAIAKSIRDDFSRHRVLRFHEEQREEVGKKAAKLRGLIVGSLDGMYVHDVILATSTSVELIQGHPIDSYHHETFEVAGRVSRTINSSLRDGKHDPEGLDIPITQKDGSTQFGSWGRVETKLDDDDLIRDTTAFNQLLDILEKGRTKEYLRTKASLEREIAAETKAAKSATLHESLPATGGSPAQSPEVEKLHAEDIGAEIGRSSSQLGQESETCIIRAHGPDFTSVNTGSEQFSLNGNQAIVIKALYEAFNDGTPYLSKSHIKDLVDSDADEFKVSNVFKRKGKIMRAYKLLIAHDNNGKYRLRRADEAVPPLE